MLEDAVYNLEPANSQGASLTSPHYVIVANGYRAPHNASCGMAPKCQNYLLNYLSCNGYYVSQNGNTST